MDQNFQKCVSDTSRGQKQHLFMHTSCKNQVLVPSGTHQQRLKKGQFHVLLAKVPFFQQILGPPGSEPKIQNLIADTPKRSNCRFFHILVAKYIFYC